MNQLIEQLLYFSRPTLARLTDVNVNEVLKNTLILVDMRANKIDVQRAVEKAFKVKVRDVNVVVHRPVARTKHGRVTGKIPGYKKAYVTLAAGEKIEFFEGV